MDVVRMEFSDAYGNSIDSRVNSKTAKTKQRRNMRPMHHDRQNMYLNGASESPELHNKWLCLCFMSKYQQSNKLCFTHFCVCQTCLEDKVPFYIFQQHQQLALKININHIILRRAGVIVLRNELNFLLNLCCSTTL